MGAGATLATLGGLGCLGFLPPPPPLLVPFLAFPAAAPLAGAEEGLSLPLSSSRKSSGTVEGITGLRLLTLWSCGSPTADESAAAGITIFVGILARMVAGALLPRPPSVVGGSGCVGRAIVV